MERNRRPPVLRSIIAATRRNQAAVWRQVWRSRKFDWRHQWASSSLWSSFNKFGQSSNWKQNLQTGLSWQIVHRESLSQISQTRNVQQHSWQHRFKNQRTCRQQQQYCGEGRISETKIQAVKLLILKFTTRFPTACQLVMQTSEKLTSASKITWHSFSHSFQTYLSLQSNIYWRCIAFHFFKETDLA